MDGPLWRTWAPLLPFLLLLHLSLLWTRSCAGNCGATFTNPANGTVITSPNYPKKYPNNLNCKWDIVVPSGSAVRLTLEDLQLESQTNGCNYDYLRISYGFENLSPGTALCLMPELAVVTSPGNKLTVRFITDSTLEERGFKLTLDTVDAVRLQGTKAVFAAGQRSYVILSNPSLLPASLSSFTLCASVRIAAGSSDWTLFTYYSSQQTDGAATSPALGLSGNSTALAFWHGGRATWAPWRRPYDAAWHRVCAGWSGGGGGGAVSVIADGAVILNASLAPGDAPVLEGGSGALLLGTFQTAAVVNGAKVWTLASERALVGELAGALLWAEGAGDGSNGSLAQVPCQRDGSLAQWSSNFWQPARTGMIVDAETPAARDIVDHFEIEFLSEVDAASGPVDERLLAAVATIWLQSALSDLPYSTALGNISFASLDGGGMDEGQGLGGVTQAAASASRRLLGTVQLTAAGALDAVACDAATVLGGLSRSLRSLGGGDGSAVVLGGGGGGGRSRRASAGDGNGNGGNNGNNGGNNGNNSGNGGNNGNGNNGNGNNGSSNVLNIIGSNAANSTNSTQDSVGSGNTTNSNTQDSIGTNTTNSNTQDSIGTNTTDSNTQDSIDNNTTNSTTQDSIGTNTTNSTNSIQDSIGSNTTNSTTQNSIGSSATNSTTQDSIGNNSTNSTNSTQDCVDSSDNTTNSSTVGHIPDNNSSSSSNSCSTLNQTGKWADTGSGGTNCSQGPVSAAGDSNGTARPELDALFTLSSVTDLAECQADEVTTDHKGSYSWPSTRSPFVATLPCVQNPGQMATRACDRPPFAAQAQWLDANISDCRDIQVSCGEASLFTPEQGEYTWPPTAAGVLASVPCMQNPEMNATMLCYRAPFHVEPQWNAPNVSDCDFLSAWCPSDATVDEKKGSYAWPRTAASRNATAPCQQNGADNATRSCQRAPYSTTASWLDSDLSDCVDLFELFNSNVTLVFLTNDSQLSENIVKQNVTSWLTSSLNNSMNYTVDIQSMSVTRSPVPAAASTGRRKRETIATWSFTVNMLLQMKMMGKVDNVTALVGISNAIQKQLNSTISKMVPRLETSLRVNVIELSVPSVGNSMYCFEETFVSIKGDFDWPTVSVGMTAILQCPFNTEQNVSRHCSKVTEFLAVWQPLDIDLCSMPPMGDASSKTAEEVTKEMGQLMSLLELSPTISVAGATMVAGRFSSLLDAPSSSLYNSSEMALHMVDTLLQKIDFANESISLPTKNVQFFVSKMNETDGKRPQEFTDGDTSVSLPDSLLESLAPADRALATRAQFSIYNNTKLFPQSNLSSFVVTASVGSLTNITNLVDPVNITLWHTNQSVFAPAAGLVKNVKCVFLDLHNRGWNSEGCVAVPGSTQNNVTLCQCNHLTNFALLLDFSPSPPYSEAIEKSLGFLSYIGSGLSAIFLGVTLVTYITFEKIRTDHPSKILMNLCAALLLLNLLFMLDAWIAWFNISGLCLATGALLHYALLASFTWMGLEAVHLYLAVVKVFNTYVRNYILKFCIVGWGIPAVVVAILLAVNKDFYGSKTENSTNLRELDDFCWIKDNTVFYVAVGGYFCLVFLLNISMFVVVLRQICQQQRRKHGKDKQSIRARELRGTVSLTFLLGITWALAFFSFGPQKVVFNYLFIIFNTLQGFMIFLFHCALRENVRYQWKKFFCCGKHSDKFHSETSKNRSTLLNRKQRQRLSHCSGTSHSTEQTDVTSLNNSGKAIG